ncbi:MAG: pyruvate kinase [Bryobacterales bacterium]|nr:pyruvate kinase [Bryobacterales bacterium]
MRNTKIVATLGPSSTEQSTLEALLRAGTDVFRINASHGSAPEHAARIDAVRTAAHAAGKPCGVLLDLQGPKIRLGRFEGGGCVLETGQEFTITTEQVTGNCQVASTSYADFARDLRTGDRVLLADGAIELKALASNGVAVKCTVVNGGRISDRKGINLPGVKLSTPSLTRKDMADLRQALECGIDMVALSFVRKRDDVLRLRHLLEEHEAKIPIISKIEKPEAWDNLDEILEASDGVMVARGDLGVEMALEQVPYIQKSIIHRARLMGRFVITATQMLESMIANPFPTRAEVSDVANAIHDGTDAVMLSAETSVGKYPVESVRMMERVATETDLKLGEFGGHDLGRPEHRTSPEMIAYLSYRAAVLMGAAAIVVFTATGTSARLVARYRPSVPIYAFTPSVERARQLSVLFGVHGQVAPELASTDEMMAMMDRHLLEQGLVKPGDTVAFVAGQPIGRPGTTNMMKLHQVF